MGCQIESLYPKAVKQITQTKKTTLEESSLFHPSNQVPRNQKQIEADYDQFQFIQINNGIMQGQIKINYQQFKSSIEKMEDHTFGNPEMLAIRASKAEEQSHYYQQKYEQMKSINESLIEAIKLVFSQDAGEELQKIIKQQQSLFSATRRNFKNIDLTNTFCQKMITYGSKLKSEESIEQLPHGFVTPQKENTLFAPIQITNSEKAGLSSSLSKNTSKKRDFRNSSFKIDSKEMSTRRSSTPVKVHVATNIYCQLCQKVFPPNQFISHTEQCKYQLQYSEANENKVSCEDNSIKCMQVNYSKMMRNLLKIRQDIQVQINMISSTKQQIDRVSLKKKLQKDLKKVIKVINQKQEEIKKKKSYSASNPASKGASKKTKAK